LKFANGIFSKSYGLLNRKDEQMQKNKVQLFVRKQNPVMQLFKRYNGHFKIADSSENKEAKKSFTLIGFKADIGSEIESILFPEWDRSAKRSYSIQKNIIYQRLKWFVLFPILVASLFLAIEDSLWFYSFLPVSVLIVLKAIISYKSWRIVCNDELIRLEHGRIMKSDTIATFYKFQWVSLQQSVYQRRKQLASLKIGHASGSLIIPYLKLSDAEELMNWIIYKIESSQLEWI
ncbi:MAG: PH domain-containing protein, partial [Calditrichaeota bacterium]|nr:PH domain-containing protein [Calditrichota bacterium]